MNIGTEITKFAVKRQSNSIKTRMRDTLNFSNSKVRSFYPLSSFNEIITQDLTFFLCCCFPFLCRRLTGRTTIIRLCCKSSILALTTSRYVMVQYRYI